MVVIPRIVKIPESYSNQKLYEDIQYANKVKGLVCDKKTKIIPRFLLKTRKDMNKKIITLNLKRLVKGTKDIYELVPTKVEATYIGIKNGRIEFTFVHPYLKKESKNTMCILPV